MSSALRGREGANIGELRRWTIGRRLRFSEPAVQHRRHCSSESRAGLQHDTPVDAPACSG
jgi:hypothetical protein